ncbi:MAG: hypothetical protein IKT50_01495 [Clostridia bacterium]|nr:hypothetical protein [Clostridia bacterium]
MNTGAIFLGFLFLINPDLITLDVFPDFIGYLLIAHGLYRLSFLEERIALARKFAFFLAVASGVKFASNLMVFTTTVESTRLTASFVFFAVEIAMGLFFVDHVFKGVQYLAVRKDSDLALKGYEVAKFYITVFFVVKNVSNFLPQGVAAFYPNIDADPDLVENYSAMRQQFFILRSVLFIVGVIALVSIGIYAARVLYAYFARCRSDEAFVGRLVDAYKEKVENNGNMQIRLAVKSAFILFFVATIFLADLYLDHIDIFLLTVFAVLVCAGVKKLDFILSFKPWQKIASFASAGIIAVAEIYRAVRLFTCDGDFSVLFYLDIIGKILGYLSLAASLYLCWMMLDCISLVGKKYSEYSYRPYRIFLSVFLAVICALSYYQFAFPAWSGVVPAIQWAVYAIMLYYHNKTTDEMRREIDYGLM